MAWIPVPGTTQWEYDNDPPDPGVGSPLRSLWLQQTNGVRTYEPTGHQVYTRVRRVGETSDAGELSKSFWDSRV